jgi:hypothetical protein
MNNELFLYWKCGEPGLWTRGPNPVVVYGGPVTIADHRSLAMGRSGRRGFAPIAWEDGGEAGDAYRR